jgi:hypothetical protein
VEEIGLWSSESLDDWFRAWTDGFVSFSMLAGLLALSILVIVGASGATRVRRRFWCRLAGRDVEAEFETRGVWRRAHSVQCCSAFETATAIACRRTCLDASYRELRAPAIALLNRDGLMTRKERGHREP